MQKITVSPAKITSRSSFQTRTLVSCALLAAITVVLSRLIIPMPNATTRFSIEAVPVFLAGMLFGPVPGMLVGLSADVVGCLFSGYGYNPLFSLPPLLYGLCSGLFRPLLVKKTNVFTIALAFFPAVVFGSILYQSWALAFVYNSQGALAASFLYQLTKRSVQFAITYGLDVMIVWGLYRSHVFHAVHLWPPRRNKTFKKETSENDP
ncbi:MAG: folate family ECF transporter S component [Ruminococcaceae bacterium]|nr:folate family ECF transporter S component [Oscillospiraceae bacterium]